MRQFSKEEIRLCKLIAEKGEIKEIQYGVWVAREKRTKIEISLWNLPIGVTEKQRKEGKWTPLWQEHDCLEWLRERDEDFDIYIEWDSTDKEWWVGIGYHAEIPHMTETGNTPLEALLRAVLEIMEAK